MNDVLLKIKTLRVTFQSRLGVVKALNGIDLMIRRGESVGIVGESGSGKSVTALSILRILDENAALSAEEMVFDGEDVLSKSETEMRKIRGRKISMIFQDPMSSLNPILTVGSQIEEAIHLHSDLARSRRRDKVFDMFHVVNIPDPELNARLYPHQFSGGMNQRMMIAMALSCHPLLMIADEPTTALDVTTQAQIIDLLKTLIRDERTSLLMITHDLGVVREICERVLVMYCGELLEEASVADILYDPLHPYTRGLIRCIPRVRGGSEKLPSIPGDVPKGAHLPSGCVFHPRCEKAKDVCLTEKPGWVVLDRHRVRCFCFDPAKKDLWRE
jgi:peptide/nickel transport system ATP-binding protein